LEKKLNLALILLALMAAMTKEMSIFPLLLQSLQLMGVHQSLLYVPMLKEPATEKNIII
jgi:hypothetical protein